MRHELSILLLLAACGCQAITLPGLFDGDADVELLAGEWRLVKSSGTLLQHPSQVEFVVGFSVDGHVGGTAGPNLFGGFYAASQTGDISMWQMFSTEIGGPEAQRGAEILQRMADSDTYEVSGTQLRLYNPEGGYLYFLRTDE